MTSEDEALPRGLLRSPVLRVALLRAKNRLRRQGPWLAVATLAALIAFIWLLRLPGTVRAVALLARHPLAAFVATAVVFLLSSARRRERIYAERAHSWLAPLPASLLPGLRIVLWGALQIGLLAAVVGLVCAISRLRFTDALPLELAAALGAALGVLLGSGFVRRVQRLSPDHHYAEVRAVRERWRSAPQLMPLSYWAVAQARAFAKPKVASRVLTVVLLAIPMGVSGAAALAVGVGAWLALNLLMLAAAASRVAFEAAAWLSPTAIGAPRFAVVLTSRVLLRQAVTCALGAMLMAATQPPRAARLGALMLLAYLATSSVLAVCVCLYALWAVGRSRLTRP